MKFVQYNGFGSIAAVNLFSYRTPSHRVLVTVAWSHPQNKEYLKVAMDEAEIIVVRLSKKL
ncbi:DUF1643 domain-containing protein [Sporosarcina sp. FA15]|uniref:DUF1643 domain-containing protein n=1 Tax=Sporosarcina sp. FA15 TaxID=3413031 RepID=UPI003F6568B0